LRKIKLEHDFAAIDMDGLAGNVTGRVGAQEQHQTGDIFRIA